MQKNKMTVAELWAEWHEGFGGKPSIVDLERQYGSKWRKGTSVRKLFSNRKKIIDFIKSEAVRRGEEESIIATELNEGVNEMGKSLNWITEQLSKEDTRRNLVDLMDSEVVVAEAEE